MDLKGLLRLFDGHCHLQRRLGGCAIARAQRKQVMGAAVCGVEPKDWEEVAELHRPSKRETNSKLTLNM